jgi:transposase
MTSRQAVVDLHQTELRAERLGPLPLVNAFLERLGLEARLERFVPSSGRRVRLPFARSLLVLLRSLLVEREPLYAQASAVGSFAPAVFGLGEAELPFFSDDAVGAALDELYDANHEALLTDVVVAMAREFGVRLDELHADTTTVSFTGQYPDQQGVSIRGQRPPFITRGFNKDHRPDLKQLLLKLTTSSDGDVPVQFRVEDGNTSDARTHIATWRTLEQVTGGTGFLYVSDSKLCAREVMDAIDRSGGRFLTVMPRSRLEDKEFRALILARPPAWQLVRDEPNRKDPAGPRDQWFVHRSPLPSSEGWPVTWVFSTLLKLKQEQRRRERMMRAKQELDDLKARLEGSKPRLKTKAEIAAKAEGILAAHHAQRLITLTLERFERPEYRQTKPGRPGPKTTYRRVDKRTWTIHHNVDEEALTLTRASEGMFPLVSNDRSLTPEQVLDAHKRQHGVERRFSDAKSGLQIAPMLLKNPGRIHALLIIDFLALLTSALIERELRHAMTHHHVTSLPLYPEGRPTANPTSSLILKLYADITRHAITHDGNVLHTYPVTLTDTQHQVLNLLNIPTERYTDA